MLLQLSWLPWVPAGGSDMAGGIIDGGTGPRRAQLAAARALSCDRVTAEVVGALQDAGVPAIVLKGPSIARWLYPSGGRAYVDTDLLVPEPEFSHAEAVLSSLGFAGDHAGFHPFERRVVEHTFVRKAELGRGPEGIVDLHYNLPIRPPPVDPWGALSAGAETVAVGGMAVRVLGRTALALHVVVHAVQHGFELHTDEDLRRAIAVTPENDWQAVADLATRLGIAEHLGYGLRHLPAGAEIADRLRLPTLPAADPRLWMLSAPRGSVPLAEFWAAATLRAKLQWIRWALLPSPAKIRYVCGRPDLRGPVLLLAYARWWRDLGPASTAAMRFLAGRRRWAADPREGP